jgi:hypothetical protein
MFTKTHIDIVDDFINWVNKSSGFMWQEHIKTLDSFCEVFASNGIWGRQLAPGDVYWEYKSATSVQFHHNRDLVNRELAHWLHDSYGIVYDELIDLNSSLCHNWQNNYPIKKIFPRDLIKTCLGLDAELLKFDHWDRDVTSHDQFCKVAYHYQRKNRYWRCSITASE